MLSPPPAPGGQGKEIAGRTEGGKGTEALSRGIEVARRGIPGYLAPVKSGKAKLLIWSGGLLLLMAGLWLVAMRYDEEIQPIEDLLPPPPSAEAENGVDVLLRASQRVALAPAPPPVAKIIPPPPAFLAPPSDTGDPELTGAFKRAAEEELALAEEERARAEEQTATARKDRQKAADLALEPATLEGAVSALEQKTWICREPDELSPAANLIRHSSSRDFLGGRGPDGIRKLALLLRMAARVKQTPTEWSSKNVHSLLSLVGAQLAMAHDTGALDAASAKELSHLLAACAPTREEIQKCFRAANAGYLRELIALAAMPASARTRIGHHDLPRSGWLTLQPNATVNLYAENMRRNIRLAGEFQDGTLTGMQFMEAVRAAVPAPGRLDWLKPNSLGRTLIDAQELRGIWPLTALAQHRLLTVALACFRYRLQYGSLPATLDALVPDFLPQPILDPWGGVPFEYLPEDEIIIMIQGMDVTGGSYIRFSLKPE